ncbi:ATP-binding cassette domain-containing protein [Paraburkholderia sp. HP33-1]|uniref:ATP-binding cassette domain-containing protein n=1 Tax=Paraburkholderia sp. HP33-1 TaxID=2883243 RepID=UPI001F2BA308|nr:ATP-binding cassette domain-containing protein [Paraburkholderia sp. HP33-1]
MKPSLELRDIHHDFSELRVSAGIDPKVLSGELHAIIGLHGAGKTTLFKILIGCLEPASKTGAAGRWSASMSSFLACKSVMHSESVRCPAANGKCSALVEREWATRACY